ncbi:hypothetical protein [Aeromicrobium sp. 179-A 4D2 NHS]|uniref:hypothetical protein n=1 Tax=Aeromicrobium sp. 179-A 4D2 NHS TaxID=3142375 RepID=UPI0039A26ACD
MAGKQGHNAASGPGEVGFQPVARPEPNSDVSVLDMSRAAADMLTFADRQIHWLEDIKDRENPDTNVYNTMTAESYGYHQFQQAIESGYSVRDAIDVLDQHGGEIAEELVEMASQPEQQRVRPLMKDVWWDTGQDAAIGNAVIGLRYASDRLKEQAKETDIIDRLTVESVTEQYGDITNGLPMPVARELAKDTGQPVLIEHTGSRYSGNQIAGATIARFRFAMPNGVVRTSEVAFNVYAADGYTVDEPRYEAHKNIRFADHTPEHTPTTMDLVGPTGHTQYEGRVGDVFTSRDDAWEFIDVAAKTVTATDAHPSRHTTGN